MGVENVAAEVVVEESVTKYATGKADASNAHCAHHPSETSGEKLKFLAQS